MSTRSVSLYGLGVALVGFVLTRFTVTLAAYTDSTQFVFAGIVPLVLGLLLTTVGVVLAVGAFDRRFVKRTAIWSFLGTGAMLVLVVLTVLGSADVGSEMANTLTQTYLSNFLIGGSVGGLITGMYSANNRRQREDLRQQSTRLVLLNRILREEVVNAVTVIQGHAGFLDSENRTEMGRIIDSQAGRIAATVENVKSLTPTARSMSTALVRTDAVSACQEAVDAIRSQYPEAVVDLDGADQPRYVWATENLADVFEQLLDNAIRYTDEQPARVTVAFTETRNSLRITVSDDGPGLPDDQRALLEAGEISEYDDPSAGFGLNVVRLLVESYRGTIDVESSSSGTTIGVSLQVANADRAPTRTMGGIPGSGVSLPIVGVAVVGGLLAGFVMGVAMEALAGVLPIIGALYGVQDPVVGWITHEFHSVVFALVFAFILHELPQTYREQLWWCIGIGLAWALVLAVVAAGVVMPVWLGLVGFPAMVPNLSLPAISTHLLWGLVLGVFVHYGNRYVTRETSTD